MRIPTRPNSWESGDCFDYYLCHNLVPVIILRSQHLCPLTQGEKMAKQGEFAMSRAIQLLSKCYSASLAKAYLHLLSEFIATLDDVFPRPLIIKYSHFKDGFDNSKRTEQRSRLAQSGWWDELWVCMQSYMFIGCSIFKEGSGLNIEIYQRHSRRRKILTLGHASEDKFLCKANIKFDDLWKHLASESQKTTRCELIFALIASNILRHLSQLQGGFH